MQLFISYSRADAVVAAALVSDLQSLGHQPYYDRDLAGGQRWWDHLLDQIHDSQAFLPVLSDDYRESDACRAEATWAQALGVPFVPIETVEQFAGLYEPAIAEANWVSYDSQSRTALADLARAIAATPAFELPGSLPARPIIPLTYLHTIDNQLRDSAEIGRSHQLTLISDLRSKLGGRDDARVRALLATLRARPDVTYEAATTIDSMLKSHEPAAPSVQLDVKSSTPPPSTPPNLSEKRPLSDAPAMSEPPATSKPPNSEPAPLKVLPPMPAEAPAEAPSTAQAPKRVSDSEAEQSPESAVEQPVDRGLARQADSSWPTGLAVGGALLSVGALIWGRWWTPFGDPDFFPLPFFLGNNDLPADAVDGSLFFLVVMLSAVAIVCQVRRLPRVLRIVVAVVDVLAALTAVLVAPALREDLDHLRSGPLLLAVGLLLLAAATLRPSEATHTVLSPMALAVSGAVLGFIAVTLAGWVYQFDLNRPYPLLGGPEDEGALIERWLSIPLVLLFIAFAWFAILCQRRHVPRRLRGIVAGLEVLLALVVMVGTPIVFDLVNVAGAIEAFGPALLGTGLLLLAVATAWPADEVAPVTPR